jgi:hypothetical protein
MSTLYRRFRSLEPSLLFVRLFVLGCFGFFVAYIILNIFRQNNTPSDTGNDHIAGGNGPIH